MYLIISAVLRRVDHEPDDSDPDVLVIMSVFAISVNIFAAGSFAIRIYQFQRHLKAVGLGPSSPYTAYMEIWIESAALTTLFSIAFLTAHGSASFIFMECLISINVRVYNLLLCWDSWENK